MGRHIFNEIYYFVEFWGIASDDIFRKYSLIAMNKERPLGRLSSFLCWHILIQTLGKNFLP